MAALLLTAALLPACSAGARITLTVFAAASLTDAFQELATRFEEAHPGVQVVLNLASSSSLREQILAGAPADVFASASTADMGALAEAGALPGEPSLFARNQMVIAVPAGNPAAVAGLAAFADPALLIGLCAAEVPCGRYARQALEAAGVTPAVDSNEPDVRALLTKLEAGELDAGLVYATDVRAAAGAVEAIALPAPHAVAAAYPIAVLTGSPQPEDAAAFVAFVLSPAAQRVLASYGFEAP